MGTMSPRFDVAALPAGPGIFRLILSAWLWFSAGAICPGAERAGPVLDYLVDAWQTENGLPYNSVTSVVQTKDGYLWVGTYNGLARFDGVRFTVFDAGNTPELKSSRVTSLFESADGCLWIGHETGDLD